MRTAAASTTATQISGNRPLLFLHVLAPRLRHAGDEPGDVPEPVGTVANTSCDPRPFAKQAAHERPAAGQLEDLPVTELTQEVQNDK